MLVTVKSVDIEHIAKGKGYQKATVTYDYKGDTRQQIIVSFANPAVFEKIKDLKAGQVIDVTVTKDAKGYNQWANVEASTDNSPPVAFKKETTLEKATGQWETREERNQRQLMIVRQSSITNAIATLTPGSKTHIDPDQVISIAERFVRFVYGSDDWLDKGSSESESVSGE